MIFYKKISIHTRDDENHTINDEEYEKETILLKAKSDDNSARYNNDRYGKLSGISINHTPQHIQHSQSDIMQNSNKKDNLYLKHVPNNTIYEVPSEHNVQITNKNSVTSIKEGKF